MAAAATLIAPIMGLMHLMTLTLVMSTVRSMPSRRPLNDRPQESIARQAAWLLMVDDDSRHLDKGLDSNGALRRRITPKSVFIAPTFSPCAEGYHSDILGRCVKTIIDIDEAAHLNFLLQKLNAQFADYALAGTNDEDGSSSSNKRRTTSRGPLLINIPLDEEQQASNSVYPSSSTDPDLKTDYETTSLATSTESDGTTVSDSANSDLNSTESDFRLFDDSSSTTQEPSSTSYNLTEITDISTTFIGSNHTESTDSTTEMYQSSDSEDFNSTTSQYDNTSTTEQNTMGTESTSNGNNESTETTSSTTLR